MYEAPDRYKRMIAARLPDGESLGLASEQDDTASTPLKDVQLISRAQLAPFFAAANIVASVMMIAALWDEAGAVLLLPWLATVAGRPATVEQAHTRLKIYEVVEFIGRWSMIDVFVVAILSALVQLGFVASIHPGPAAVSFALSVAFTMLSAQSFDPRVIWRGLPLRSRTGDQGQD